MAVEVTAEQINEVNSLHAWNTRMDMIRAITGLDQATINLIITGQAWRLPRKPSEPSEAEQYEARRRSRQATREASMREVSEERRKAWEARRAEIHARLDLQEGKPPREPDPLKWRWHESRFFLNEHDPKVPKRKKR